MGNCAQQLHAQETNAQPRSCKDSHTNFWSSSTLDHILPLLQFSPAIDLSQRLAESTKMLEIY